MSTPRADRPPQPPPPPRRRILDGGFVAILALALAAGAGVWWRDGAGRVGELLLADLAFAALLLPKIAGGVLLASTLALILPRERVRALIGPDTGWRGLAIASLTGALVPGGPAVLYPLAAGLVAAGADLGAAVAMVSGFILLSLNRTLIWELSFLPADLVALRVALTLAVPLVLGAGVRALAGRGRAP